MKRIPLTRGQFAIVDDEDFEYISQWKWYAAKQPKTFYAARTIRSKHGKITVWMHRVINGTPIDKLTDHIDGNGLNNRRKNLRNASHQDNMLNNVRHKIGSSKYRGVSWHVRTNRWIAQITINRKNNWIGSFTTERSAYLAYLAVRKTIVADRIVKP